MFQRQQAIWDTVVTNCAGELRTEEEKRELICDSAVCRQQYKEDKEQANED
jgi:hypothetical protein